jgi:heme exporter protein B
MNAWMTGFYRVIKRECIIGIRKINHIVNPLLFFIITMILFPLSLVPDKHMLTTIAPGIVWVASLFSLLLSQDRIFQQDIDDGILEQWSMSNYPMPLLVLAKLSANWLLIVLPLVLISPLYAMLFNLSIKEMFVLATSILLGSPALLFITAFGQAVASNLAAKGMIVALIVFPLVIPLIVFGAGSVNSFMQGYSPLPLFALLLSMSLIIIVSLPFAIAMLLECE